MASATVTTPTVLNGKSTTNGSKPTTYTTQTGLPPVEASEVAKLGMAAYRAPSLLQPHRAREALADAHAGRIPPLVGFFMGFSSTNVSKWVAQMGWDFVWIDWEHTSMGVETMTQVYFLLLSMLKLSTSIKEFERILRGNANS